MPDPQSIRTGAKLLRALAIAIFGAIVTSLIVAPSWSATALMTDDAYYYLKIAQNIVEGRGSTFDGFEPTNGYHPLWMLVVCAIVSLTGRDPLTAVSALMLTNAAIAFATAFMAHRLMRDRLAPGFEWHAVALFLLPNVWIGMTNGMETCILSLLLLVFVHQVLVRDVLDPRSSPGASLGLGVLLGLVLLARLDTAFMLIAIGVVTVISCVVQGLPIRLLLRRGLLLGGGAALVAAPYFWWNVTRFGSTMPISGAVKSTFPSLRSSLSLHTDLGIGLGLVIVVLVATCGLMMSDRRRGGTVAQSLRSPFPALALGAVLHFVHAWLFLDWGVYWWHFTVAAITLPLAVPALLARFVAADQDRPRWLLHLGAAGVAIAGFVMQAQIARNKDARHSGWLDAAVWARSNTVPDAVFALKDAGLFSYFADRQVVNLDGKASGVGYIAALRDGAVTRYLDSRGVDYLADIESSYQDDVDTIFLPRAGVRGLLLLVPRRIEVFRSTAAPHRSLGITSEGVDPRFAIWRFDSNAVSVR